jgi:nitrogen fixation protein NifB
MLRIAETLRKLDVAVMNIMPLIPQADFAHLSPVPDILHKRIRQQCGLFVEQISHCRQCRADACGLLGEPLAVF